METLLSQILDHAYGVKVTRISRLADGEKHVFRIHRSAAPDWIARLYPVADPSPSHDSVQALAQLLAFLEQHHYSAERVVRTSDGALTSQIGSWRVLVTTYLGAPLHAWQPASTRVPASDAASARTSSHDPGLLATVGALLGRLHALDTTGPAAAMITSNGLQAGAELAWAADSLTQMHARVPPHLQEQYTDLLERIEQVKPLTGCLRTIIHGDCHLGNVVVTPTNEYAFVDWEAAGWGVAVTDLGLLLSSCVAPWEVDVHVPAIHAVIDGYCAQRVLTPLEQELLPDALCFRILVTLAGAFERRCSPDYQPSERFWGSTYDEWERHERQALLIARAAQARLDTLAA